MDTREIAAGELEVGQALPWDVYDGEGGLLAAKGLTVLSDKQRAHLLERGKVLEQVPVRPAPARPPSVVRMLNEATRTLQALLADIASERCVGARRQLDELARRVMEAVALQPDVAQACILHNQDAGPYAIRHSLDAAVVSLLVARAMDKPADELHRVALAALTMNVGMLDQQERMQSMRAPLNAEEARLIREHPGEAVRLLRAAGIADDALLACVLAHHESEDGSGYPAGCLGADIPELAKIVSLADRYCARISARSYRKPMVPSHALRDILLEGKATIDAKIGAVFIRELGVYPIGTFVRLLNGEIGVVSQRGASTTTPLVDALVGPRGAPYDVPLQRDTHYEYHSIRAVLTDTQAAVGFRLSQLWGAVAAP